MRQHLPRTLAALVGLLAAVALGSATAQARVTWGAQGLTSPGVAAQVQAAGGSITRIEVSWAELQPTGPGPLDPAALARVDAAVRQATSHGMRVVMFLDRTPCWASAAPDDVRAGCTGPGANGTEVTRYRPADVTTAVPVSVALVQRYAASLAAFQVWNEPDQVNEKYWAGPDKVATYVALVKALYGPLKQAAPSVPVLAGSFVGVDGRWLKAMYDAGIKGSYDGLAVQFYDLPLTALRTTHIVQRQNGDATPLWLTEFGYTTCYRKGGPATDGEHACVTPAVQARNVTDVLAAMRTRPWIKAAIQFEATDQGPDGYSFGLLDVRGRAKPVLAAVRKALRSKARPTRPKIRLRRSGDHVVLSGTASGTELLLLRAYQGGQLRYRQYVRPSRLRRVSASLPAALGTSRLSVTLGGPWTGRGSARL